MQEAEKPAARKETWQTSRWMFTRGSASGHEVHMATAEVKETNES